MQKQLIINTLINNSNSAIATFSKLVDSSGCNIIESQFKVVGKKLSLMLLLAGSWDALAKAESMLSKLERQEQIKILVERTENELEAGTAMPYVVDIVGIDRPGLMFDVSNFISSNELTILEIGSNSYIAPKTNAKMFSLHMIINIPSDLSISAIRSDFIDFCDHLNLDAIMEPVK